MRKEVQYYTGYEITEEVIKRINLIEQERINEGITSITTELISSLDDLCDIHLVSSPEQENIILGEDWYIMYTKLENQIEINEWLAINNVKNKLVQTMEMFSAMKKILLETQNTKIFATMRHSTSYKFYQLFLKRGYLEEISNRPDIDDDLPTDLETMKNELKSKYATLEEYLLNSDKELLEDTDFEDFIHHFVIFKITDKFTNRYKKLTLIHK